MAETDPLGRNWKLWGGILAFIVVTVIAGLVVVPREVVNALGGGLASDSGVGSVVIIVM